MIGFKNMSSIFNNNKYYNLSNELKNTLSESKDQLYSNIIGQSDAFT